MTFLLITLLNTQRGLIIPSLNDMLFSVGLCEITVAVEQKLLPPQICERRTLGRGTGYCLGKLLT